MDLTIEQYAAFEQIIDLFLRQKQSIKIDKPGSGFELFICDLIFGYPDAVIKVREYGGCCL